MTTLAEISLLVGGELGDLFRGTADDGTTSTLEDAALKKRSGTYTGGVLWLLTGNASPAIIDVEGHENDTLEFATQGTAIATDDTYGVIPGVRWSVSRIVEAINRALQHLAEFTQYDESLTTVANQEEYTLPVGVSNVARVYIRRQETVPYGWSEHTRFRELSSGKLRFLSYIPASADRTIRLAYNGPHDYLVNPDDTLNPGINVERLKWEATALAISTYLESSDSLKADSTLPAILNQANQKALDAPPHRVMRESGSVPMATGW